MRKAAALIGLTGLLILPACSKKDTDSSGQAAEPPATSAAADPATFGPDGVGKVKLGASEAEVTAAGFQVADVEVKVDDVCLKHAEVERPNGAGDLLISGKDGVSVVVAGDDMHTPEGIKIGSSMAEVQKAYPQLAKLTDGSNPGREYTSPVPGNANATYYMLIDNDKVFSLNLHLSDTKCAF